jgi:hypothetical protein
LPPNTTSSDGGISVSDEFFVFRHPTLRPSGFRSSRPAVY